MVVLLTVDERYSNWAREVGVEVGSVHSEKEKETLSAELMLLLHSCMDWTLKILR